MASYAGGTRTLESVQAKVSPTDVERLRKTPNVNVFAYQWLRALIIQPSFREGPNEFIRDNAGKPLAENPLHDVRVRKGLDDGQILDLIHAISIFAWANRLMLNLGEPVFPGA